MKRGKRWIARVVGLGLVLALLASAAGAGVSALGETPKQITLGMVPDIPVSEPLIAGDKLQLKVSADADFAVYSNSTVIYYDKTCFEPCDAAGAPLGAVQGEGIEACLAINPAHPMVQMDNAFGDVNVTNLADYPARWKDASGALLEEYEAYGAIALKVPYLPTVIPGTGQPDAETPWFGFWLKVRDIAPEDAGTASILMSQDAVRAEDNRNAVMYYSAGGTGWLDVDVILSAPLEYTVEAAAESPVTVSFTAGAHGSLTGGITSVRNIEQDMTIAAQRFLRWPGVAADTGYELAGWLCAEDLTQAVWPETASLADMTGGVYTPEITLTPVFRPRQVQVRLYLLDMRPPQQEIPVGEPLDIYVNDDFSTDVEALAAEIETAAGMTAGVIDPVSGYFLELLGPAQANNFYEVPETDDDAWPVMIAKVHRGTWFITYDPDGGSAVARQEKGRGETVYIAGAPARKGYTFLRWTDGTGSYAPNAPYSADEDLHLTAVWQKNPDPVVAGGASRTLTYKKTDTLLLTTSAPPAKWSSSNSGVVSVNENTGEIRGVKTGTAVITGTDADGFPASVTVTVRYAWWQWLIIIFLFGWLWY